jgi:hypothetical protein
MGNESEPKMKTRTKNLRILTYGEALTYLNTTTLRQAARAMLVIKKWTLPAVRGRVSGEFLLVSSDDLDDRFSEAFREYATQATRLLVLRQGDISVDRLLSRIVDLQIRTPQRFYVIDAAIGSGKSHFLYSLLARLAAAHRGEDQQERILDATIENGNLHVVSANLNRLDVPIAQIPAFNNVQPSKLQEFDVDEDGAFIYWPQFDVHLGWAQLQQLVDPQAAFKASQKNQEFNRHYGKAVGKLRKAAGLEPSDIPGLSKKQLGRIERGECRLTSNAIEALSKAHKTEPIEYMQKLAERLTLPRRAR